MSMFSRVNSKNLPATFPSLHLSSRVVSIPRFYTLFFVIVIIIIIIFNVITSFTIRVCS